MRRNNLMWGAAFFVVWATARGMLPLPSNIAVFIGAALIIYAHLRFKLRTFLKVGLGLPFLGNEYIAFAYGLSLLPFLLFLKGRMGFTVTKAQRWLGILFFWCVLSYVVSQFTELNLGAFWFFIVTFGSSIVFFPIAVQAEKGNEQLRELGRFLAACLLWQSALITADAINFRFYDEPGDWAVGSMRQPEIAFLFAGCLVFLIATWVLRKTSIPLEFRAFFSGNRRWLRVLFFLWLMLMLHWTAVRTLNYGLVFALCWGLVILLFLERVRSVLKSRLLVRGGLVLASMSVILLYRMLVVPSTTFGETYRIYVTDPGYNHKYIFLQRALWEIPITFQSWLTGTGPGTVGSRAANSRAYDTMFKARGSQLPTLIPPFTSAPAREYFVDLYDAGYATRYWRSQTLASPFSSLISMLVELGMGGLFIFLSLSCILVSYFLRLTRLDPDPFYKAAGLALYFSTLTIFVNSFLNTFLERPLIMIPYWIMGGLAVGRVRELMAATKNPRSTGQKIA